MGFLDGLDEVDEEGVLSSVIVEEVSGKTVNASASRSSSSTSDESSSVTFDREDIDKDLMEYVRKGCVNIVKDLEELKGIDLEMVFIEKGDPIYNLDRSAMFLKSIRMANSSGQEVEVHPIVVANLAQAFGAESPILKPVPVSMVKAIVSDDKETISLIRDKIKGEMSLYGSVDHTPTFKFVWGTLKNNEVMEWTI